jgi:hypothetical protein
MGQRRATDAATCGVNGDEEMSNEEMAAKAVDYLESLTETADCEPVDGWPTMAPPRAALMRDVEKKLTALEGSTAFEWTRSVDASGITITVKGDKGKLHGFIDHATEHVHVFEAIMLMVINNHFRFEMRRDRAKEYTHHEEQMLCLLPEWRIRQKEAAASILATN